MIAQQTGIEAHLIKNGSNHTKLDELLSPRLPFGLPQGKNTGSYAGKNSMTLNPVHAGSFVKGKMSSPRISQDDTHITAQSV